MPSYNLNVNNKDYNVTVSSGDMPLWHSPKSVDKYYCQNLNGRNVNAKSQIHS